MKKAISHGKGHVWKKVKAPLSREAACRLKAGTLVLFSGVVYTARDQAHLRFVQMLEKKRALPVDLKGQVIYYTGPTPPGNRKIGSCGPTTSGRMDSFTSAVLRTGVRGLIGKGRRSEEVRKAIKDAGAVYFLAPAGAGAYLSEKVVRARVVAFKDLGPEAVYRLEVKDIPLVVGIDSQGNDVYAGIEGAVKVPGIAGKTERKPAGRPGAV
jgi:fumarate hydratase subunit beta